MALYNSYDADEELEALYAAITGRRPFSYSAAEDPLYRSFADRYLQNGRMAMRDTMGSAAALTGGYGSSYAQAAGQQQYDEYLRQLSEALPELYGMAYQQYIDEGEALRGQYDLARQRQEDAYGRERDAQAAAYQKERDALANARYQAEQDSKAAQQSYKQRQDSYQNLVKLISGAGYRPSDAELSAAGLSRASADALLRQYERDNEDAQPTRTVYYRSPAAANDGGSSSQTAHKSTGGTTKTSKSKGSASAAVGSDYKSGLARR